MGHSRGRICQRMSRVQREKIVGRMVEFVSINGLHPELSLGGNVSWYNQLRKPLGSTY